MNNFTFENYPDIRDLTRKLSKDMHARIGGHLEAVKAQFRPGPVFGQHLASVSKSSAVENPRNASAAFAHFTTIFKQLASSAPLNVDPELTDAIDISFASPVLSPFI